jgi:hypothetical protein
MRTFSLTQFVGLLLLTAFAEVFAEPSVTGAKSEPTLNRGACSAFNGMASLSCVPDINRLIHHKNPQPTDVEVVKTLEENQFSCSPVPTFKTVISYEHVMIWDNQVISHHRHRLVRSDSDEGRIYAKASKLLVCSKFVQLRADAPVSVLQFDLIFDTSALLLGVFSRVSKY